MSPNEGDRTMIPMLRAEYRRVNHPVRISSPRHWVRSQTKFTTLTASSSVQLGHGSLTKVAIWRSDMARPNSRFHVGDLCKPCLDTGIMTED